MDNDKKSIPLYMANFNKLPGIFQHKLHLAFDLAVLDFDAYLVEQKLEPAYA